MNQYASSDEDEEGSSILGTMIPAKNRHTMGAVHNMTKLPSEIDFSRNKKRVN
jgi:hypothetical protein